jgi:hypothetical protein
MIAIFIVSLKLISIQNYAVYKATRKYFEHNLKIGFGWFSLDHLEKWQVHDLEKQTNDWKFVFFEVLFYQYFLFPL